MKKIKTRPDGPDKMGLTDPCPWAEKMLAHLSYRSIVNKKLQENKVPTKIEPKRWEIAEDACLNERFLYRGMTCPPRLGFLK